MCDIVIATDHYGTIRIPGWVREVLERWTSSPDFPRHVPMYFEDGEFVIDVTPPETSPPGKTPPPRKRKGKSTW